MTVAPSARGFRLIAISSVLMMFVAALALIAPGRSAAAQGTWSQIGGVSTLPGASGFNDLSATTFSGDGMMWTVDNRYNRIIGFDPLGGGWSHAGTWSVSSIGGVRITDPEGITWVDGSLDSAGGARFLVVDEAINHVREIRIDAAGATLLRSINLSDWTAPSGGDGIEGISWSHDESTDSTGIFYIGVETSAEVFRIVLPTGSTDPSSVTVTDHGIPEVAGLTDDPTSDTIYLLSESNKSVYETSTAGAGPTLLFTVAMTQPEGIHFDPATNTLHIIGEGRQEYATWQRSSGGSDNTDGSGSDGPRSGDSDGSTSDSGDTDGSDSSDTNTSDTSDTNGSTSDDTNSSDTSDTNTSDTSDTNGSTSDDTNSSDTSDTNTSDTSDTNTSDTSDTNTSGSIMVAVDRSSDDAEQRSNGSIYLNSSDLELTYDRGQQTVGVRFSSVAVPAGALITAARIDFIVDETPSVEASLQIRAEDSSAAPTFASSTNNISDRPTTSASTSWSPGAWDTIDSTQSTPSVAAVVQELVDRSDWSAGSPMAFVFTGTGERVARSFDNNAMKAPVLHIEWDATAPAPTETPEPTPPPTATPEPTPPPTDTHQATIVIANGNDDAEEWATGRVILRSSDLEMAWDRRGNQTVGLRFQSIPVPAGAQVVSASIEYEVDETTSGETTLTIRGEMAADAAPFTSAKHDLSSRTVTNAAAGWTPAAWNQRDVRHNTPDLSAVVQEIVDGAGWSAGNDLAILVTGTGERVAESYNGEPAAAARLHVEWIPGSTPPPAATPPPATSETTATFTIASGADDIEVRASGRHHVWSGDLDIARTASPVALRYDVCVAPGATVTDARFTVVADERDTATTSATVQVEDSADALPFASQLVRDRQLAAASVSWPDWSEWSRGSVEVSTDISSLVSTVVSRPDWSGCGAIVFVITGSGDREFVAYETDPGTAPTLTITSS